MSKHVSCYGASSSTLLFIDKNLNAHIAINSGYKCILGTLLAGFWYTNEHNLQIAFCSFYIWKFSYVYNILFVGLEQVFQAIFIHTTLKHVFA